MIIRKSDDRGLADHGWLKSYHTFSFADYYDPDHMGFRSLRVINEDRVAPDKGFGAHPHRDMEILSIVMEGALTHRDSMGNQSEIRAGDVQLMSAGQGVTHSEFNASAKEAVHFFQIWILPDKKNLPPSYQQKPLMTHLPSQQWKTLVSPDGKDGSLVIHQQASVEAAKLDPGASLTKQIPNGRYGWLQVVSGAVNIGNSALNAGDGASFSPQETIRLEAQKPSLVLWFDLN